MSNQNNISTKLCVYGCGLNLYWNIATSEYWELFAKKKHICPNRSNNNNVSKSSSSTTTASKPNYYNRFSKQPKPKMSNSLELLSGSIDSVQKKYEILSDIVNEYSGKVHGSQSHILPNNTISLIVYYEVLEGTREKVKEKFNTITRNQIILKRL